MHKLLKRQLSRVYGDKIPLTDSFQAFKGLIEQAYEYFDEDRTILEHSLDISTQESIEQNDNLNKLLNALPDTFFWVNQDHDIVDFRLNSKFKTLFPQLTLEDKITHHMLFEHNKVFLEQLNETLIKQTFNRCVLNITIKQNIYHFEVRFEPWQKTSLLIILRDISQQRELELKLLEMATTDSLTQVFNRAHTYEIASMQLHRCIRQKKSLSVIMLDIDFFKQINDQYGHQVGDIVLQNVARCLKDNKRLEDILGRYGGEEFLLVLPDTTLEESMIIAERIRLSMSKTILKINGHNITFTSSFGISTLNGTPVEFDDLIKQADNCLYKAKKNGRNQVIYKSFNSSFL